MYNIAICDDSEAFISYMKRIIKKAQIREDSKYKVYEFSSGEQLARSLEGNIQYDLLILDMQLSGINGDDTASIFRSKFPYAVLVFCSGVCKPTVKSFKATPYRYLMKSCSESELVKEMKDIIKEVEKNLVESYLVGHYRNNMIKVKIRNILYIVNAKRGSRIIVNPNCAEADFEGKILVDSKLLELSERFSELVFAHNSYIVNINHVEKINNDEIFLDNGECLSISRTYYKLFRESFTKSIANKY